MIAHRWKELWDLVALAGALGALVVALPFVAILSLSLFPYARRPGGPVLPLLIKAFVAALGVGELAALVLAEWSRWKLTRLLTGMDHDTGPYGFLTIARHIEAMVTTEVAAAFAIVVAVPPLTIVILLRVWRRMDRGVRGRMCVALSVAAWMVWTGALVAWALVFSQMLGFHLSHEERYELTVASFGAPLLGRARSVVLGFATLATVVMLATRSGTARSRIPPGIGALGGTLLLLGGIACAVTRGRADDGRHPLSYAESSNVLVAVDVPPATRCQPELDGPILELASDGARLDGSPITLDGATSRLTAKRDLWKIIHPNHLLPALGIAAASSMELGDVMPFVDAIRSVWDSGIDQIVAPPREAVTTRTLGVLLRTTRFCRVSLPDSFAAQGTWGDLSAALQRQHD